MKPKLSQPTGVCCYCVLSESHCNSTSECPLFSPFVFSTVEYFFSFLFLAAIYFSVIFFFPFSPPFSFPQIHIFTPMWLLSLPRGSHLWGKKQQHSFGRFCMCLCFHTKLLWYFEAFQGLFSNFCGAFYQTQSQPMHMEGETRAKRESSVISTIHNPYLETRWGLTSTSEPSCQQPIEASSSDCSLSQKTSRGEPCILLELEGFLHYAPTSWFQQLISTHQSSLGLFSGLLCGQTSGLAVIALWVKA